MRQLDRLAPLGVRAQHQHTRLGQPPGDGPLLLARVTAGEPGPQRRGAARGQLDQRTEQTGRRVRRRAPQRAAPGRVRRAAQHAAHAAQFAVGVQAEPPADLVFPQGGQDEPQQRQGPGPARRVVDEALGQPAVVLHPGEGPQRQPDHLGELLVAHQAQGVGGRAAEQPAQLRVAQRGVLEVGAQDHEDADAVPGAGVPQGVHQLPQFVLGAQQQGLRLVEGQDRPPGGTPFRQCLADRAGVGQPAVGAQGDDLHPLVPQTGCHTGHQQGGLARAGGAGQRHAALGQTAGAEQVGHGGDVLVPAEEVRAELLGEGAQPGEGRGGREESGQGRYLVQDGAGRDAEALAAAR